MNPSTCVHTSKTKFQNCWPLLATSMFPKLNFIKLSNPLSCLYTSKTCLSSCTFETFLLISTFVMHQTCLVACFNLYQKFNTQKQEIQVEIQISPKLNAFKKFDLRFFPYYRVHLMLRASSNLLLNKWSTPPISWTL